MAKLASETFTKVSERAKQVEQNTEVDEAEFAVLNTILARLDADDLAATS